MNNHASYIMQEQVRNQIPAIMSAGANRKTDSGQHSLHIISVAVVSIIYLLAVTLSS